MQYCDQKEIRHLRSFRKLEIKWELHNSNIEYEILNGQYINLFCFWLYNILNILNIFQHSKFFTLLTFLIVQIIQIIYRSIFILCNFKIPHHLWIIAILSGLRSNGCYQLIILIYIVSCINLDSPKNWLWVILQPSFL